jgi:phosphopantetheinyl transferase
VLPFLGRVLAREGNRSIEVERVLDLGVDLHLLDHVYVQARDAKPASACLPILPLMMSLEVMAEVAAELAPGRGLIGFEDVRASRWIELCDETTLALRIAARARPDDGSSTLRVHVTIHVDRYEDPPVEGVVLFDVAYRADVALDLPPPEEPAPHALDAAEIYGRHVLWHGPLFQALTGRPTLAREAALGQLFVRAPDALFRLPTDVELLIDPVVLDAVGQLLGLWCLERDRYPFPIGIEKLELYRPTPAPGTVVPVHVHVTGRDVRFLNADAEVQDGDGHVWFRVRGLRDWMFAWPPHHQAVRRDPWRHLLGRTLERPGGGAGLLVEVTADDVFDADLDHVARLYLTLEEMTLFRGHAGSPERQQAWLLGRIAAKDVVRALLAREAGGETMRHPASFRIASRPGGAPVVEGLGDAGLVEVSIAHVRGRAVALATRDPGGVGIDLETIGERGEGFLALVTAPDDRARLEAVPAGLAAEWVTRTWCAKEAAGKALGVGVSDAPLDLRIVAVDASGVFQVRHAPSGASARVVTWTEDDRVYATGRGLDGAAPDGDGRGGPPAPSRPC